MSLKQGPQKHTSAVEHNGRHETNESMDKSDELQYPCGQLLKELYVALCHRIPHALVFEWLYDIAHSQQQTPKRCMFGRDWSMCLNLRHKSRSNNDYK